MKNQKFLQNLIVRSIKKEELKTVDKYLSHADENPDINKRRLKDQETRNSVLLVVWYGKKPIARVQIRFEGAIEKEVRDKLKSCPHIESLLVNKKFRKKGVASFLINKAEAIAKKKGFLKIGLSVELDNEFLQGIYLRRGYEDWKKGNIIEEWDLKEGIKEVECMYLIKKLK